MRSARGARELSKYMVNVQNYVHLSNLIDYLNTDMTILPGWEQDFISDTKLSVQYRIKDFFESSASIRQKFASIPPDAWKEPETGLFQLLEKPRAILGYLPAKELQVLDDLCKTPIVAEIEDLRRILTKIMDDIRASESDRAEISELLHRDAHMLQDVEELHKTVEYWTTICEQKMPILNQLRAREEFLDEVEEFERNTSGDKTRYFARNSIRLAEEYKFRIKAARQLLQMDEQAVTLCQQFKADTGRDFEVDGVKYLDMIGEQRVGRSSHLSLSLAKLRPEAMPVSALKPSKSSGDLRRRSLHERGVNPNGLIRKGKDAVFSNATADDQEQANYSKASYDEHSNWN